MPVDTAKLKRLVAEELLAEEPYFLLTLDAQHPGVRLPPHVRGEPVGFGLALISLHIGRQLAVRIPDLDVGDWGVSATLLFNRAPYPCRIPWDAVIGFALASGRAVAAFEPRQGGEQREQVREPTKTRGGLRLVGGSAGRENGSDDVA